ncbi:flagellar hook protein FlgE [Marinospirillum alkaliphilum]|uniref:Flagellar hook protein FlgE n=1 Tax=Marinospirillum alkaliphilum DSM 21637 TaxID=1122209 RepID=A0A1K1V0B5_9GAMM|nr:flagellar hook protein FlgE [Marinospirillum alkaliphilum]SFX18243.1 flagellar hook protein FlgE [Marinospirillum alkaliphilum DSM 21637]
MSFNIGLSGLRAAQMDLSVTGNNIANASTVGFKQSRAEFGDVYNASMLGTGRNSIGSGVLVERISQQHTQGNVNYTDRALDLAINGNGYFILSNNGQIEYTRAGYFDLDKDGYIVNNTGKRLQGYQASLLGDIQSGALGDIQLSQTNIQPRATSLIQMELNLDARAQTAGGASPATAATITFTAANDTAANAVTVDGVPINADFDAGGAYVGDATVTIGGQLYNITGNAGVITLTADTTGFVAGFNAAYPIAGDVVGANASGVQGSDEVTGNWSVADFDPRDRSTYTSANSTSIYDSLGNEHILRQYYIKVDRDDASGQQGNAWAIITSLNGVFFDSDGNSLNLTEANWASATPAQKESMVQATKFFNVQGDLQGIQSHGAAQPYGSPADLATYPTSDAAFTLRMANLVPGAGFGSNIAGEPPVFNGDVNFRFRGTTQYGSRFAVQSQSQDGYTTGRLAGLEVGPDGTIFGRYTNGQNRAVGQVPLATFTNPDGLRPNGSTGWLETTESGIPAINEAGAGITGSIAGGALEESNVDLAEELVKMIIGQRNYQANAKTIQTQDTITQTIINLR